MKTTFPSFYDFVEKSSDRKLQQLGKDFNEFSQGFTRVNQFGTYKIKNKNFLLGTSPSWSDIHNNLDAPRAITDILFSEIEEEMSGDKLKVLALLGSAGCGKSTILKRLGLRLVQNGRTVYHSYSEYIPDYNSIYHTIESLKQKVVLVFDNADLILFQLPSLIDKLSACQYPPIILISTRTNVFDTITSKLDPIINLTEHRVPNLQREEIIEIIKRLDDNNLLGHLKGLSYENRIKEFELRAKKQILVAMREATKGESFNSIIKSEYDEVTPLEAKFLMSCVALTTEAGFTISKQDFISISEVSPAETLFYLERNLSDIIIKAGSKEDRLLLRHRTIADFIIENCLDVDTLKKVYLRILSTLAPEINIYDWKSRKFALYREIINHYKIYNRFKENINNARELYESLIPYFNMDYQFWLQYGSLEMEGKGGSLELAENYLNQSLSLRPKSIYVKNALGNLYFRKSILMVNESDAYGYRTHANMIMDDLLADKFNEDVYTYCIYLTGNYNYVTKKISDRDIIKKELEHLRIVVAEGLSRHPVNRRLITLKDTIFNAYLRTAVEGNTTYPALKMEF